MNVTRKTVNAEGVEPSIGGVSTEYVSCKPLPNRIGLTFTECTLSNSLSTVN